MSLKENIEMVKEELNSEEKFFENAVKAERFVKKYRTPLIVTVVALIVFVIANVLYTSSVERNVEASNAAFAKLMNDSSDEAAKNELRSLNPELYDVWALSNAVATNDTAVLETLSASTVDIVADFASYELAVMKEDSKMLNDYAYRQEAIFKDMALIETAVLMLEAGKIDEAHTALKSVAIDSPVYKVSRLLMHYGVK